MNSQRSCYCLVGPEDRSRLIDIEAGRAPRLDYRLVAEHMKASVIECAPPPTALQGHKATRLLRSLKTNFQSAIQLLRRIPDDSIIYSTGETWGLPVSLAQRLLGRSCVHVVYVHRVFSPGWGNLLRCLNGLMQVDGWICITRYQAGLLRSTLGSKGSHVAVVSQGVDTAFFDPAKANPAGLRPYILAVGTEMRNYTLLFEAVRNLDVEVVVKASSAWMAAARREFTSVPSNVRIISQRLSYVQLRDLYAGAALVVTPLYDTPQAAGITTILEAMTMQKCVVATQSSGLPDILIHGETGTIVESSPQALMETLEQLLAAPQHRYDLACAGRRAVMDTATIEHHAQQVSDSVISISER